MDIEDRYKENVKWQTEEIRTEIKNLVEGKQTAKSGVDIKEIPEKTVE